ncbi:hypothetical protein MMA86_25370, partial [Salmonella enterica]|nr:hypothetical protein [Salmonella enterica]
LCNDDDGIDDGQIGRTENQRDVQRPPTGEVSADGALAIHFRRRALPAISMEVVIGVSRGSIVLPRQGEVAPPKAVTEGA